MDFNKIFKGHSEKIEEIIEKATGCSSPDELLAVAEEYGIEIDAAQAEEILALIRQPSLLSEDELAQVAGGKYFPSVCCPNCGSTELQRGPRSDYTCIKCGKSFTPGK